MAIEVTKAEGNVERQVLIGMIVSTRVVSEIAAKWNDEEGMFANKWSNTIGSWCVRYYRKWGKAIYRDVTSIYYQWAESGKRDPTVVEMIGNLLDGLSKQFKRFRTELNEDLSVDIAGEFFNKVSILKLAATLEGSAGLGKISDALAAISKFGAGIEIGHGKGIDVFTDRSDLKDMTEHKRKPIFVWKGDLGQFMGDEFERDAFITLLGAEKRGKTWSLMDIAYTAMLARNRVAFFQCGDLSRRQMTRRLRTRVCGRPLTATKEGKKVRIPIKLTYREGEDLPYVEHKFKRYKRDLTEKEIWEIQCKTQLEHLDSHLSYLRLSVHPNSSINVTGIKSILDGWERAGWTADMVVIDYADILAAEPGFFKESRDMINETWKAMRRLSQEKHVCLVTGTQIQRAAYEVRWLQMKHISDEKRKLSHVTAAIGLNQSDAEKELGLLRYNFLAARDSEHTANHGVYVAQALDIANAAVLSCICKG